MGDGERELKTQNPIPLTPAEQVRRIRDAVTGRGVADDDRVTSLSTSRLYTDALRAHVGEMESQMFIYERPFESHTPVLSKLIVWVRTLWNWMSTKWYILPMMQQQNQFNAAVTQSLRDVVAINESLMQSVNMLQTRVYQLEQELAKQNPDA